MVTYDVNFLAVIVAGIAHMVIGALWYSPVLFGKKWMHYMGWDNKSPEEIKAKQKAAGPAYAVSFISSLITSFVLAMFLPVLGATTIGAAALVAILFWIGLIATHTLSNAMYSEKQFGHWLVDTAYPLVSLIVMSAILVSWV